MEMIFRSNVGNEYRIKFRYPNKEVEKTQSGKSTKCGNVVECRLEIRDLDNNRWAITAFEGKSRCGSGDLFTKEVGRRIALARAIKLLDRPSRMAAWRAYWDRGVK